MVEEAQRTGTAVALTGGTDSSYLASWIVVKVKGVRQSPGMGDNYYPSFSSKPASALLRDRNSLASSSTNAASMKACVRVMALKEGEARMELLEWSPYVLF